MDKVVDVRIIEPRIRPLHMHPKKFGLWVFMATILMAFMALTSAYLVKRADGNWLFFQLPGLLYVNSAIAVMSSVVIHRAYLLAKKGLNTKAFIHFLLTAALGVAFLVGQFQVWKVLVQRNVYLVGNPAGSFVYVITGLHGLHIISALVLLFIAGFAIPRKAGKKANLFQLEMCVTYWHFLGALWLYLLFFFLLFR